MKNTTETLDTADLATIVALDAVEAGRPEASELLVGVPATISVGSDRYAARIIFATKSLHTITAAYETGGESRTFRKRSNGSYKSGRSFFLHVGTATSHLDPSR